MKKGDEFYEIKMLVSKKDIDLLSKKSKFDLSAPHIIFDAVEEAGVKVYEVWSHEAKAYIKERHIALEVAGNGVGTTRNGFKRHTLEE